MPQPRLLQTVGCALCSILLTTFLISAPQLGAQAKLTTWKAAELWRIDGGDAGEPFADLRDYVVLKDGTLWALDFKFQDIRRYSADGKPLNKVARKGQGPGELANANGMVVASDGTVWVNDPSNGRFSVYSADGKFAHQFLQKIGGYSFRWGAWANRITGEIVEQQIGRGAYNWRRFDNLGKLLGEQPYTSCPSGMEPPGVYRAETPGGGSSVGTYPFGRGGGLAPDGTGNAWCAATYGTRVALVRIGARMDTVTTTTVEIPNIAVSNEERAAALEMVEKHVAKYRTNNFDKSKLTSVKPGIAALHVDSDGRLWVQHADAVGKRSTTLDVFDGKGKHLGRVVVPLRQNPGMPIRALGNLLWLSMLDDDDVPYIVHYRLQP